MDYAAGKPIGPTFADEGIQLADRRFSWGPDGRFTISDAMAAADVTALRAVIAAHDATRKPPDPYGFRVALASIFAGTPAEKLERMFQLRQRAPGLTEPFLQAIRGPELGDEEAAWVRRIAAEVKARIGLAAEVLTKAEYDAMKALAGTFGMGTLVA